MKHSNHNTIPASCLALFSLNVSGFETALGQSDSDEEDLPFLPDFFSNKHFLLYGELDIQTRRSVIRYITAYDG